MQKQPFCTKCKITLERALIIFPAVLNDLQKIKYAKSYLDSKSELQKSSVSFAQTVKTIMTSITHIRIYHSRENQFFNVNAPPFFF